MLVREARRPTALNVRVASTLQVSPRDAIADLENKLGKGDFSLILIFYSIMFDTDLLIEEISHAFAETRICGCSTAGEITASGFSDGSIVAVAFPKAGFRMSLGAIEDISKISMTEVFESCQRIRSEFLAPGDKSYLNRSFSIMLIDGLSNSEEKFVAAVRSAIPDIPLVGGSAGDGLRCERTFLFVDGKVIREGAVIILVESTIPFRVFTMHNFEPTSVRFVVTAVDVDKRIIHELNAEPAASVYAAAIGASPRDLGPLIFASHPLGVKMSGQYYSRSILSANPDGSLSLGCAIEEGLVLTLVRPVDIIASTRDGFLDIERHLGTVSFILGFECLHRKLEAEGRQSHLRLGELYKEFNLSGFHSYGEQYNSMHLNCTLTGVAFGAMESADDIQTN